MTTKKHTGILLALLLLAMIAGYAAISIGHAKAPVITVSPPSSSHSHGAFSLVFKQ